MRSLIVSAVAVTSLAFAGMALAGGNTDGTGIKDSPHDFADDVEFGVSVPGSELGKTGAGWNGRNENFAVFVTYLMTMVSHAI